MNSASNCAIIAAPFSLSGKLIGSFSGSLSLRQRLKSGASTASKVSDKAAKPFKLAGKMRNFVANCRSIAFHAIGARGVKSTRCRHASKTVVHSINSCACGFINEAAVPTTTKRDVPRRCANSLSRMPCRCASFQHKRMSPS